MERSYIVVMVTTVDEKEAEKIARSLLDERLVACVNVIGRFSSYYLWKGKVEEACECIPLLKSRLDLFERLVKRVKALHSYEVPEFIALPIVNGAEDYLAWLESSLT